MTTCNGLPSDDRSPTPPVHWRVARWRGVWTVGDVGLVIAITVFVAFILLGVWNLEFTFAAVATAFLLSCCLWLAINHSHQRNRHRARR